MTKALEQALKKRAVILFVGAGISQQLGLPSHADLVAHIGAELGYDPAVFATLGDHLALAEYYMLEKGGIGELRSWMDRHWHSGGDIGQSEVHRLIVELDVPVIYTTNYDTWLERAFKRYERPFHRVVSVNDLTDIPEGATQIVKLHGDLTDDQSIVLSESSYFDRLQFESPLDIRLRSDLLGRTVLFLGYSLSDINIRYMIFRLDKLWAGQTRRAGRPKSYIFLARPNPIQERILKHRGITPITSDADDPTVGLVDFLSDLVKRAGRPVPS